MALVLDTGPVLAAFDRSDRDHDACATLLREATEPLVLPAPVIVELDYLLERQLGPTAFLDLLRDVCADTIRVEALVERDYPRVLELCAAYADAPVGFVDAAVLAVVERLGESKLATLDRRHFTLMRPRHTDALELLPDLG